MSFFRIGFATQSFGSSKVGGRSPVNCPINRIFGPALNMNKNGRSNFKVGSIDLDRITRKIRHIITDCMHFSYHVSLVTAAATVPTSSTFMTALWMTVSTYKLLTFPDCNNIRSKQAF